MNAIIRSVLTLIIVASGFAAQAIPLTSDDDYFLGDIENATPSSAAQEVIFINTLRSLGPTDTVTISGGGQDTVITRSDNEFSNLPMAVLPGDGEELNVPLIDLSPGWLYVYGKYGNDGYVWYVGGLSGTVEIPERIEGSGGLSHRALFNAAPGTVPDGGTTVAFLGMGLLGLATLRRSFAR